MQTRPGKKDLFFVLGALGVLAVPLSSSCTGKAGGTGGSIVATTSAAKAASSQAAGPVGGVGGYTSGSTSVTTGVGGSVGDWTDAPGACPTGMPQIDITTAAELSSASRGDAPYDTNAPATCYFIHSGQY